ncbi:amino acid ABC transporter permease, partial [Ochrobactrum sp. C6C9]|nr:amino acid ABC transporter permease [Ochrobactrum sp. C6C9]
LSLVIGVLGAWAQTSKSAIIRVAVDAYIQAFRNTPPLIQLLFFYFGLGAFTPAVDMGGYYEPIISSFGWAVISLGIFGGAFNVEIFRAGLEAVPETTKEAAESLSFSSWQIYMYVTLPLAFRISLPALTNNLVSLAKTTSLAYVIAVPEMTYVLNQV